MYNNFCNRAPAPGMEVYKARAALATRLAAAAEDLSLAFYSPAPSLNPASRRITRLRVQPPNNSFGTAFPALLGISALATTFFRNFGPSDHLFYEFEPFVLMSGVLKQASLQAVPAQLSCSNQCIRSESISLGVAISLISFGLDFYGQ